MVIDSLLAKQIRHNYNNINPLIKFAFSRANTGVVVSAGRCRAQNHSKYVTPRDPASSIYQPTEFCERLEFHEL